MESSSEFVLPIKGLGIGVHRFVFDIAKDFFSDYEQEIIQNEADFQVVMQLDKRSDMVILLFDIQGGFATLCDRCSANIRMPISGNQQNIIKYKEVDEAVDTDEYIVASPTEPMLDVKDFVYEAIMLSMPMVYRYDCENEDPSPCDKEVLEKLESLNEEKTSPLWDQLLNLKDKLN